MLSVITSSTSFTTRIHRGSYLSSARASREEIGLTVNPTNLYKNVASWQASSASTSSSVDSGGGIAAKKEGPIENVKQSFRSFTSSLIVAVRQAEKVANGDNADGRSSEEQTIQLKESVVMVLNQRQQLRATATLFEDKLRGNLKETDALHCCLKSTPCVVGGRKRKFSLLNSNYV